MKETIISIIIFISNLYVKVPSAMFTIGWFELKKKSGKLRKYSISEFNLFDSILIYILFLYTLFRQKLSIINFVISTYKLKQNDMICSHIYHLPHHNNYLWYYYYYYYSSVGVYYYYDYIHYGELKTWIICIDTCTITMIHYYYYYAYSWFL